MRQMKVPGLTAATGAGGAAAAAPPLQLSSNDTTFLYQASGLSKLHSEWPLASGGVVPPQPTLTTPILVSTLQSTEQDFSSLEPLSVTTLIDLPSGAMTQVAKAGNDGHRTAAAAKAAQMRRAFIQEPPNGDNAALIGRATGDFGSKPFGFKAVLGSKLFHRRDQR